MSRERAHPRVVAVNVRLSQALSLEDTMQRLTAGWILLPSLLLLAGPAAQGTTWPGAAPCNTTLQACIDAASPGDSIEIATNGPVAESLTVTKSLNLRPATGFTPVIAGSVLLDGTAAAGTFAVESLTLQGIEAFTGAGGISVFISGNHIALTNNIAVGIQVSSLGAGTGTIAGKIAGNQVTVTGSDLGAQCSGIIVGPGADGGVVPFKVVGNTVNAINCREGWGMLVQNGNGVPLSVDVVGNVVTATGTNNGIFFFNPADTSGSFLTLRAVNNVVTGAVDVAGIPGGLVIDDSSTPVSAVIVNNTVVGNQTGLVITGRPDLGATITGAIANNIVANNSGDGFIVDPGFAITNHHNLVHGNGTDSFTPGPGTIDADPQFASADFQLTPSSPAVNAGDNSALPPGFNTDILNLPRIVGGVVDMGALEVQSAPVVAVPALSPWGAALLVLLLAAFALWRLRSVAR
jgi:exosortase sorting signal-containing protein